MRAVADAGPLIHLAWLNHLDWLYLLFEEVFVPLAVRDEILRLADAPDTGLISDALTNGRLILQSPRLDSGLLETLLDPGESEALQLSLELRPDFLLTDDLAARKEATRLRIPVMGTIRVLTYARDSGLIDRALPLILELRERGQWIGEDLIDLIASQEQSS
jgi:predicted nucleic acid-binding protein